MERLFISFKYRRKFRFARFSMCTMNDGKSLRRTFRTLLMPKSRKSSQSVQQMVMMVLPFMMMPTGTVKYGVSACGS